MSGGQIGTAVGFVAGFFLPGGPQVWAAIGGAIGGAIDPMVIEGPKVGEVPQQTSQEGIPRPIVFARSQPMAGQIIITAPPNIVTRFEEQGKSGPKTKRQIPYRTYAIGVCRGPGIALLQAWRNGKLVYDAEDPGMSANNAEFLKYATWHSGSYDQMPDPGQEAKHGAGVVHAYRGTAYCSFVEENVEDNRGAMSQWMFRVSSTARVAQPDDVEVGPVYANPSVNAPGPYLSVRADGTPFGLSATSLGDDNWTVPSPGSYTVSEYDNNLDEISSEDISNPGGTFGSPQLWMVGIDEDGWGISADQNFGYCKLTRNGATVADLRPLSVTSPSWWYAESFYAPEFGGLVFFDSSFVYIGVRRTGNTGTVWNSIFKWPLASSGGDIVPASATLSNVTTATSGPGFWWHLSRAGTVRFINVELEFKRFSSSFVFQSDEVLPSEIESVLVEPGDFNGFGVDETLDLAVFCHDADQASVYRYSSGDLLGTFELTGASNRCTRVVFSDSAIFIQRRERFYRISVLTEDGSLSVAAVVDAICDGVGLDASKRDTADLASMQCRGFTVTNRYPAYSALQALSDDFFFQPYNADGKLNFRVMGGNSVATIYESDMIDTGDDDEQNRTRRGDTISVPRVLHYIYYDVAGGLATDKQRSERPEDAKNIGEQSIQSSVAHTANEAATIVTKKHAMAAEGVRGELTFSLPDKWLSLTESDPVIVQDGEKMVRGVIQQVDIDDGEQRYRVVRDRQSIHTLSVEGIPAAPVTPPPSSVKGQTLFEFLDIPLWRDEDDKLGFYAAVGAVFAAWPGATVELSIDGGASYIESDGTNVSAVMGSLTTALGDHPDEYPDETNSFQVAITTPNALLEQTDLPGLYNGRNLAVVGEELIQFAGADEVSEGVWELSTLLRGRQGSSSAEHEIGTRFVLLDEAVFFIAAQLAWRNLTLTFRATTYDTPVEDATIVTAVFTGRNQAERKATLLEARRDSGNAIITWVGVGRLGQGVNAAQGAYFQGYRVTLTDGTVTQTFDQAGASLTTSLAAFTGPVTISVQQRNSITGLGPAIESII